MFTDSAVSLSLGPSFWNTFTCNRRVRVRNPSDDVMKSTTISSKLHISLQLTQLELCVYV